MLEKPLDNFNEDGDIMKQYTLKKKESSGFCVERVSEKGKVGVARIRTPLPQSRYTVLWKSLEELGWRGLDEFRVYFSMFDSNWGPDLKCTDLIRELE